MPQRMLVKSPGKRMSAEEACAHPWIAKHRPRQTTASKEGVAPVAQAQAMTERQAGGEAGGEGEGAADERSTPLDPKLVRRLRNFAVRVVRESDMR